MNEKHKKLTPVLHANCEASTKYLQGVTRVMYMRDIFRTLHAWMGTWVRDVSRIIDQVVGFAIRELIMSNSARLVFITAIIANHVLNAAFGWL